MEAHSPGSQESPHLDRSLVWGLVLFAVVWAAGYRAHAGGDSDRQKSQPQFVGNARGQLATTPSDIPAQGWKDILLRVYRNISNHRVLATAAGIGFYSLLAIFPAIAALVSLYGLFSDPATISGQLNNLIGILPGGAVEVIRGQLTRVASHESSTLGLTFVIGLGISLWSANAGMKALFDGLNIVYGEEEKRGLIKLNAVSLAFTTGGIAFLLLALSAVVVIPVLLQALGANNAPALLAKIGRWPVMFIILTLALTVIYRYGPSRDKAQWRWITWGGAFASILWIAASIIFSWYAANFGKFNETYGSLGAVIGFMTWMWLSAIAVLIGAELDAEMEHQTARDTTEGPPQPMGMRGAKMADTVAAGQH